MEALVNSPPVRGRARILGGVVPRQLHDTRQRLVGGDCGQPDAGQLHEHGFDLARLDAVAADLHLPVCPAKVDQALRVGSHEVTSVVGPLPAQGLQRPEANGVLTRVQVARHSDPADHQLADLPPRDELPARGVCHRKPPSIQRQPDAHRPASGQPCRAGHHRGLGRAVGVPHFAAFPCQPAGQLGRAGLTAQDQQADPGRRARRPQRRQRRHRRDHRHLALR